MIGLFKKNKKRIRGFHRTRDVEITTPLSIRAFVFVCALSLVASLVFGITNQLSTNSGIGYLGVSLTSNLGFILDAFNFFMLPILIAMAISNDHRSSQYLIVTFCILISYKIFSTTNPDSRTIVHWLLITAISLGSVWWLFFSKKIRTYYAVLSKKPLPLALEQNIEENLKPKTYENKITNKIENLQPSFITLLSLIIIGFLVLIAGERIFHYLFP